MLKNIHLLSLYLFLSSVSTSFSIYIYQAVIPLKVCGQDKTHTFMEILLSPSLCALSFVGENTEEGLIRPLAQSLLPTYTNCNDNGGRILVSPNTRLILLLNSIYSLFSCISCSLCHISFLCFLVNISAQSLLHIYCYGLRPHTRSSTVSNRARFLCPSAGGSLMNHPVTTTLRACTNCCADV